MSLEVAFLRRRPQTRASGLEQVLAQLLGAGRRAWPDVALEDDVWVAFVADRAGDDPVAVLPTLDGPGLYLAAAVLHRRPRALERFHDVLTSACRVVRSPVPVEDLRQALGERLLVASGDSAPRLAAYRAQGTLDAWVRTAAARLAVNLRHAQAPAATEQLDSPSALAAQIITPDAELSLLASRYRDKLRAAFTAALATLSPRDRNLLRFHFLQGLTGEALATMYGVTRRTVHRWLEDVRLCVLEKTRARLADELSLPPEEMDGLLAALQSQLASVVDAALRA